MPHQFHQRARMHAIGQQQARNGIAQVVNRISGRLALARTRLKSLKSI